MALYCSTIGSLQRLIVLRFTQVSKGIFWPPLSVKSESCLSARVPSMFCSSVASHILEQEEIINRFIKEPAERDCWNERPKTKRNFKENTNNQVSLGKKDIEGFVAVKKNPRSQYKRGRVAKLVMRCAGQVLCGETNFGHLIMLEQVKVSEDLLQATITWSARSSNLESGHLIDYQSVTCQLENLE